MPPDDELWALKRKVEADFEKPEHGRKDPRSGQRTDHDSPDMGHPDQSQNDHDAERRIARGEKLHRKPK